MLRKTGERWEFESELALENFAWSNLESLFGLTALKRQYYSNGEICDILALNRENRLVVIELKNAEDRYIVQQLTRYYHNLINEKPFESEVNYEHPIRMIGVTPSFHRHNLMDRLYNKLEFQFIQFEIQQIEHKFYLKLTDIDTSIDAKIAIPYQQVSFNITEELPAPPQVLLEHLGGYPEDKQQQQILRLRQQILSFDRRMQETTTTKSIQYGRGKTKLCAELYFDKKQYGLVLFVWLPLSHRYIAIGRHRIWTDWQSVLYIARVAEGLGKVKTEEEWKQTPQEKWPRKYLGGMSLSPKSLIAWPVSVSGAIFTQMGSKDNSCSLESVINFALKKWSSGL